MFTSTSSERSSVGEQPQSLTSYAVFESFIEFDTNSVNVDKIFTRKCFDVWLFSRRGHIKHPGRSFQRALYAHIRGADGRKPFPEDVEREILSILRDWSRHGKENPWDNVFGKGANDLNVGLKGFKSFGFHEQKSIVKKTGEPIKKRTRKKKNEDACTQSEGSTPKAPKLKRAAEEKIMYSTEELQVTKFSQGHSPWNSFLSVMNAYMPPTLQKGFLKAALKRGVPLSSFSLVYLLNTPPAPDDVRFKWDFLMPPFEEREFEKSKPIGQLLYSSEWVCIGENAQAIELFGSSSVGQHVLEKNRSIVNSLYCNIRFIPEFYGNGEAWCRLIMNKATCSGVFLMKCVRRGNEQILCQLQDQSDIYPEVATSTFFI